jgi:O-antigen/teichoic acid export membrane protein
LRFGSGIFGGSLISMLLSPFNKLMLSRYTGVSSIPVYEIAFTGSMQVRSLIEVGLQALMPEISRIGANMTEYARDRISRIYRRAMKLIFLFGIPLYGGMIILVTPLMKFWLRQRFLDELPLAFRIMLVGTFINLLIVPSFYILLGIGRIREVFISRCIASSLNMIIVVILSIYIHTLTPSTIALGLIFSWFVSASYINWKLRRIIVTLNENG